MSEKAPSKMLRGSNNKQRSLINKKIASYIYNRSLSKFRVKNSFKFANYFG